MGSRAAYEKVFYEQPGTYYLTPGWVEERKDPLGYMESAYVPKMGREKAEWGIREELKNKMSPQAAINAGFERAFVTIMDANITTLLVALILYSIGTGAVKGFAVTLSIGIVTSMFTAIVGTRAIVNLMYGGRSVKRLMI